MSNDTMTYLFDLDDTLAATSSVKDGVARPIDAMMEFLSVAPALPLVDVAKGLLSTGARVIILTARTDRDYTRAQVARYGLAGVEFLFRADDDNRADHKVKADHVRALLDSNVNIMRAWDDKVSNVEMFRSFGIDAVQV